jgi:hypothetical protein
MMSQLDTVRAGHLMESLAAIIKAYIESDKRDRKRIYEVVYVLAALLAPTLLGSGDGEQIRTWFNEALDNTLADLGKSIHDFHWIETRYPSDCHECGRVIETGERALWLGSGHLYCRDDNCGQRLHQEHVEAMEAEQ